jgi:hypothetical protein
MARFLKTKRTNPANPNVFGEDAESLAWKALGVGGTAWVNDSFAAPIVKQMVPSLSAQPMMAKLTDAATTGVSAWLVGEGVSVVNSRVGRQMKIGGLILGAARFISAFVPGFQISATMPKQVTFGLGGGNGDKPKALPAGNGNGNGNGVAAAATITRLGIGSMGI